MKKKKLFYKILNYIFLFFAFSIIGYIWETCLKLVQTGLLVNSGTLHGPWLPIYGTGGIAVLILLKKYKNRPMLIFLFSLLVCTILEYIGSCYLEFTKGVRYWDYSNYFININGRICLEGAVVFGLAGCLTMYLAEPIFTKIFKLIPNKITIIICTILTLLFIGDMIFSAIHPNMGVGITYTHEKSAKD